MIVYLDVFSGDEMFSDALNPKVVQGCLYEVEAKMVSAGEEVGGLVPEGEDVDDSVEQVLNVVKYAKLNETTFTKKQFITWFKRYMKKVLAYLQENNPDRVGEFKTEAGAVSKVLVKKFKEFTFYVGESYDQEAGLAMSFWNSKDDGSCVPTFWFFRDGVKEEKY
eukprot:TRINITY_DN609_c1_g1_i1.p1 TRINITY_DN609_c1_g1~~TRINITY_DN609_c1_g1_i1.p1  ORF type:complete len:165 (-),score=64.12 TRINITY_DN609_c1_g1_i1:158-652(-)